MSNAQGHIIAGTFVSLVLAFFLYNYLHVSLLTLVLGVILGILSAEFPDIDHPKALPRKVLRGVMSAFVGFVFLYLFFDWRVWRMSILKIVLFLLTPIIILFTYEKFIPHHRGATHKLPGLITVVSIASLFALVVGFNFVGLFSLVAFASFGFFSHIILDHL
jgi:uncharacterized membrane protein YeaQ/YmgE (transglycosylase-associated protein family)